MGRNGTAVRGQEIIQSINERIADEEVLGYQVYWTLYGGKVVTEDFRLAMEANGFSPYILRHQTAKRKFIEVVEEVAKEYGTFPQKIAEHNGRLVMKIIKPVIDKIEETISFNQDTTVVFKQEKTDSYVEGDGVQEIVDEIINVLAESLSAKQIVTIAGLGVFKPATRSAREGRNPKTGETIQIPAKNTIKFKPSKKLREAINS